MTLPKHISDEFEEKVKYGLLSKLIDSVGFAVTRDYESKNGLWECMSLSNVASRDRCSDALERWFATTLETEVQKAEKRGAEIERSWWMTLLYDMINKLDPVTKRVLTDLLTYKKPDSLSHNKEEV